MYLRIGCNNVSQTSLPSSRHDESLLNIPGGHGGHGGGRGDHHSRHPQTWPRNYVPGGRRRFDRKEPDGGLSAVNGKESLFQTTCGYK